ncbi:G:T-mismatch repair DNA endonuclease (very short patch repair protein) [Spirosoma sp. LMG 31447]|uniref:G:T-mismatch repair DNA endonuclease (Very short patch repair protein) n=2 Tax=Spirosoma utsteinense TaxID=2585773 RepID=A0ABR6WET2_9BACT|nr:G:T-mismatch repair DNA endonuclease (very short patch repair protein) [Spirosoma utsteinense]
MPKHRVVIFIHGCFWHGHEQCTVSHIPKTRTDWWLAKFERNQNRDKRDCAKLRQDGWDVVVIYECELRKKNINNTLHNLTMYLKAPSPNDNNHIQID